MIATTPGASTTGVLEGAPAGLTLTARLVDGDEILATVVTVTPRLDSEGDPLSAYTASFTAPGALPVVLEWLEDTTVVGSELVSLRTLPQPETDAEAAARERLERMLGGNTAPVLSADDITDLLTDAQRPDANGLLPTDEDWTPTWDLNAAAADGWMRKAGLVTTGYDFGEDGQYFKRSQMYAHCLAQAALYRRRASGRGTFKAVTYESPYSGPGVV